MSGRNPDLAENPQGPVVPSSISNGGGMAPQATSTIGMPTPPPQNITATGNSSTTTVLNPFGPRNDLLQGGIVMDLPAICYSQYIQIPNQLEISDDTVPWTIIAQLPYDPTSDYMNAYCRAYALQHERYNGDIMYQLEVIGNASYSGTIIVGWVPQRLKTTIANPTDLQTYSYKTMSVTLPSVEQFILKDARQRDYYRKQGENMDERPHLVIAVHTSIVSPLRTGITVRIRLASRFASVLDGQLYGAQPFFLSKPIPLSLGPSPSSSIYNGRALGDIFPHMYLQEADYRMCVDGVATTGSANTSLIPGRNIRTFKVPFPTIGAKPSLDASAVLCKKDCICFYDADYPIKGISSLIATVNFDFTQHDAAEIVDYISNGNVVTNPCSSRIQKAELAWANGTIKAQLDIVNGFGRATLWVYQGSSGQTSIDLPQDSSGYYTLPYTASIGVVNSPSYGIIGLPLNWRHLTISSETVTTVLATEAAPTTYDDSIIQRVISEEAAKISADSILQFDLEDPESRQRVATIRWSSERYALVIATADLNRYSLYPSDVRNLIVGNWAAVPKASGFPNTVISQWASRSPASTTRGFHVPNAALVAEMGEAVASESEALFPAIDSDGLPFIGEGTQLSEPHPEDMDTLKQYF